VSRAEPLTPRVGGPLAIGSASPSRPLRRPHPGSPSRPFEHKQSCTGDLARERCPRQRARNVPSQSPAPSCGGLSSTSQIFVDPTADALVFTAPAGGPLFRSWGRAVLRPAVLRAGLDDITFHGLRHSFVAIMVAAGCNVREVSEWAGHNSVAFTLTRYGGLFEDGADAAVDRLDALLDGKVAEPFRTALRFLTTQVEGIPPIQARRRAGRLACECPLDHRPHHPEFRAVHVQARPCLAEHVGMITHSLQNGGVAVLRCCTAPRLTPPSATAGLRRRG